METQQKYTFWDWIKLKPLAALREKHKVDYLTDKDVEVVRQILVDKFASFIEKVQNLDNKPEQAGIVVKGYRNILMSFALALAHPDTDYLAEDGFENLLLLMIEDLSILLGNQKPKFQETVRDLAKDIGKVIYINRSDKNFPAEDPVIFKNLQIGMVRTELAEKKEPISKELEKVSKSEEIKSDVSENPNVINIVGEKEPISEEEAKAKLSNPPVIENKKDPVKTRKKRRR